MIIILASMQQNRNGIIDDHVTGIKLQVVMYAYTGGTCIV